MQYSYNAARGARGGSFTFTINTDSIKYDGSKKIETKNSLSNWNKVTSSVNLTELDKIVNARFDNPPLQKKPDEFSRLMNLYIQSVEK